MTGSKVKGLKVEGRRSKVGEAMGKVMGTFDQGDNPASSNETVGALLGFVAGGLLGMAWPFVLVQSMTRPHDTGDKHSGYGWIACMAAPAFALVVAKLTAFSFSNRPPREKGRAIAWGWVGFLAPLPVTFAFPELALMCVPVSCGLALLGLHLPLRQSKHQSRQPRAMPRDKT